MPCVLHIFCNNSCVYELFSVILRRKISINDYIMATYTLTINERSAQGKALLAYLETLRVNIQRTPKVIRRKTDIELAEEDIKLGRVTSYDSVDDLFQELGI